MGRLYNRARWSVSYKHRDRQGLMSRGKLVGSLQIAFHTTDAPLVSAAANPMLHVSYQAYGLCMLLPPPREASREINAY
jgi:hypothetical protein